jgi:putative acetyltransferase
MNTRTATEIDRGPVRDVYLSAFPAGEREVVSTLALALLSEQTRPGTISLVAQTGDDVVGHVAFSPVIVGNVPSLRGYILAPLAVRHEFQGRGAGSRLVEEGMHRLSATGVHLVFVYGDPEYYGRFGFTAHTAKPYEPPYRLQYPFGWQAAALDKGAAEGASGAVLCVAPLCDPALW